MVAARAGSESPETDCVLATLDLQQLLDQQGISLANAEPDDGRESLAGSLEPHHHLSSVPGSAGELLPENRSMTGCWLMRALLSQPDSDSGLRMFDSAARAVGVDASFLNSLLKS